VAIVGFFLFSVNVIQGFRGAVQAWPFASYPTFQYHVDREMPDLLVTAIDANGIEAIVLDGTRGLRFRSQRDWGIVWKILGVYGDEPSVTGLRAFYARAERLGEARPPPKGTRALRFYRAVYDVTPDKRGAPAARRSFVFETRP
jgi:hypothetical protein